MKTSDQITFANIVLGQGVYRGIVNITLGAYGFSPTADGKVDPDPAITARLRMDLKCAADLRDALDAVLKMASAPQPTPNGDGSIEAVPHEKTH